MKKLSVMLMILLLCCSLSLSACSDSSGIEDKDIDNQVSQDTAASICSLSNSEITEEINKYDNLYASDSLYVNVPEESCLYDYTTEVSLDYGFEEYYEKFVSIFNYLFPDREIDTDYLFYTGGSSTEDWDENGKRIQDYNKVEDYYDILVDGTEGRVNLYYNENYYYDYEGDNPVLLELGNPVGYGYGTINKGKTVYLTGMIDDPVLGISRYPGLGGYDPLDYLEVVGIYSPDSSESFKLMDKTVSIKDAVDFFEEYINNFPCMENATLDVMVTEVYVLKISEDLFGYYFLTSGAFDNVPIDYSRDTSYNYSLGMSDYLYSGGIGFMLESSDVDVIWNFRRIQTITTSVNISEVITIEDMIKLLSERLTSHVQFEVQRIELVYASKWVTDDDGNVDYEISPFHHSPSWKITLYNSNDDLTYICYADAKDGENFRYQTTPDRLDLIP